MLAFIGGIALLVLARAVWDTNPGLVFLFVAASLCVGVAITMAGVGEGPLPAGQEPPMAFRPMAYIRQVLGYRAAAWYVAAYFAYWFGIGGITPFLTRFGNQELGIPESETFVLLLAVMFGTLFTVGPAGWLGDKLGKRVVTQWGMLAFAIVILIGSQAQTREQVVVAMALAGVAQSIPTALAYPLFTELVPSTRMGELSGLSTMVWSLAQPVGATLLGLMADSTGSLRVVLLGGGVALFISWLLLLKVSDGERETG
jgi:UMF1 family MFS transporter